MTKNNFLWLAGAMLLTGCASKTSPNWQVKEVPEIVVVRPPAPATESVLHKAASVPSAPLPGEGWKSLLDGRTLAGWQVTDFTGGAKVECEEGLVVIGEGASLSGINFTNLVPKMNYEVALDAMKLDGSDFFCGLTFPVGDSYCSLIVGGWGGSLVGLSSLDDQDASENETTDFMKFDMNRWYRVRVRVTETKIEAWLDDKKEVSVVTTGKRVGLRFGEIEDSKPFGVATYQTRAAIRDVKIRDLSADEAQRIKAQKN
ncbi:MAG TPA: DUF1080 domain-containing protein [Verrucomicrobiae bacterium]|nr:DUF1080 domain-containing protein [Verrucomicrobiae bacterium]